MKANKNNLYLMWSLAIILCMLMSLFALIFTSCARSDGTRIKDNDKTLSIDDEQTPEPEQTDDPGQGGENEPAPGSSVCSGSGVCSSLTGNFLSLSFTRVPSDLAQEVKISAKSDISMHSTIASDHIM